MDVTIKPTSTECGDAAARLIAGRINCAIERRGRAAIILATGASQFDMLAALVKAPVDWSKVTAFHLDEYLGLGEDHPASFRRYLRERFHKLAPSLKAFHYVCGDAPDVPAECRRLGNLLAANPIDVACIGIGENGHLAFNDPPADFRTDEAFLVVELDAACRRQQMGEGWFSSLDDVPRRAISMSVRQILKSRCVVVTAPDGRKAAAVRSTLEGPLSCRAPGSALRMHGCCHMFLDDASASSLSADALALAHRE